MTPTCSTCRYFVPDDDIECEFFNEHKDHDWEDDPEFEIDQCRECAAVKNTKEMAEIQRANANGGTCHRHAPQPVLFHFLTDEEADTTTIWPAVDADEYCGEYKMIDRKKK